ncbi:hypothetical protein [Corynebacterium aquatimens]|uniref:Uncharacterized protein n=1 Tax=Corynebacterium aquatimens TaxID=1190508 RepID=A0A931E165_9CORY|nr:hypothetical protein [Corynebacterium aquatimens]MBG6122363.1 hypothetical protein [Corynebacterium aquatimens]WJY65094.1 hypothetical protein CAQUA_01805 [Corynebacterium aquatimens]
MISAQIAAFFGQLFSIEGLRSLFETMRPFVESSSGFSTLLDLIK